MKLIVTLSITAVMVVHAVLGCCSHHEHHATSLHEGLSVQQACHRHHDHKCGSEDSSDAPQDCDEENCVFVASKHNAFQGIDWASLPSLAPIARVHDVGYQLSALSRIASEDAPTHTGPALHVWQCVWVI